MINNMKFIMYNNIKLVSFRKALKWIKSFDPHENNPVYITPYGERPGTRPFRVWHFANCLLLMSNENAKTKVQYIITEEKWEAFLNYAKEHPDMSTTDMGKHYRDYKCTNYTFWPSIMSICKSI